MKDDEAGAGERMMKHKLVFAAVLGIVVLISVAPANAQQSQVNQKAKQKADFYNAPRRIQIVDERPIISDFREAPQAPQMIQLPPPPQGFGGAGGGQGGGALPGDGGGGAPTPVMQLPAGEGIAPYRTPNNPMGALPKSGFGPTNIPARGMGPRVALPGGTTTGVHGAVNWQRPQQAIGQRGGPTANSAPAARAMAPAASYGNNYQNAANTGVSGQIMAPSSTTAVSGRLMSRLKGN